LISGAIPKVHRNDTLTSLAGTMRRCGMGAEEIEAALLVTNNKRCDPPLAEDEVRKIASSVCRYKPAGEEAFR
jgi:putative DNA primase/helicase